MRPSLIPLRTLLVGLGLLLGSLGLARGLVSALERTVPPDTRGAFTEGAGRIQDFLAALPGIAAREDAVLVVGSSIIQHGFSPEAFEQRLGEPVTAYNLGFPGVDPEVHALLARRVAEAFGRTGQRARFTLVEFTPFQATLARAQSTSYREHAAVKKALLLDADTLARVALRSPEEASHLGALRAMGGTSSHTVTRYLSHHLSPAKAPAWWPGPANPVRDPERQRLVERLDAGIAAAEKREVPEWDPVRRGEVRWVFEETREAYATILQRRRAREVMESDQQWRVRTSDLLELRFDEAQVRAFIEAVRTLASASRDTLVLLAPRHREWATPTPEGRARLAEVLARIEREAGVKVLDLAESPEFTPEDFIDVTHLNETLGRPRLSRRLADEVARRWGAPVALDGAH